MYRSLRMTLQLCFLASYLVRPAIASVASSVLRNLNFNEKSTQGNVELEFTKQDLESIAHIFNDPNFDLRDDPVMQALNAQNNAIHGLAPKAAQGVRTPSREAELDNMLSKTLSGSGGKPDVIVGGSMTKQTFPVGGSMTHQTYSILPPPVDASKMIDENFDDMIEDDDMIHEGEPDVVVGGSTTQQTGSEADGDLYGVDLIRKMFPHMTHPPVDGSKVIEEDFDGSVGHISIQADPIMADIMNNFHPDFAKEVVPAVHKAAQEEHDPTACHDDIQNKCAGATSHLHCLGANQEIISEACRKEVGQTVPFKCSKSIDRFCPMRQGPLEGMLTCLNDHMQTLDGPCSDAVRITNQVINQVNNAISKSAAASTKEAALDAKLGFQPGMSPLSQSTTSAAGWLSHSRFHGLFFCLTMVAFVSMFMFPDDTKKILLAADDQVQGILGWRRRGLEGAKLLDGGIEISRPNVI